MTVVNPSTFLSEITPRRSPLNTPQALRKELGPLSWQPSRPASLLKGLAGGQSRPVNRKGWLTLLVSSISACRRTSIPDSYGAWPLQSAEETLTLQRGFCGTRPGLYY